MTWTNAVALPYAAIELCVQCLHTHCVVALKMALAVAVAWTLEPAMAVKALMMSTFFFFTGRLEQCCAMLSNACLQLPWTPIVVKI